MKAATVKQLKDELKHRPQAELVELCLRLSKFKKENKELLTYLLYESLNEEGYVNSVKSMIDTGFEEINRRTFYYIKKSVRKILREIKKYIRYSKNKETEVELLIYFCEKLKAFRPSIKRNRVLQNIYDRQVESLTKKITALDEDLQFDYMQEMNELLN